MAKGQHVERPDTIPQKTKRCLSTGVGKEKFPQSRINTGTRRWEMKLSRKATDVHFYFSTNSLSSLIKLFIFSTSWDSSAKTNAIPCPCYNMLHCRVFKLEEKFRAPRELMSCYPLKAKQLIFLLFLLGQPGSSELKVSDCFTTSLYNLKPRFSNPTKSTPHHHHHHHLTAV